MSALLPIEKSGKAKRRKKNGKPDIAPLRPSTLAPFRAWGGSTGAGRTGLPLQMYRDYYFLQTLTVLNQEKNKIQAEIWLVLKKIKWFALV